MKAKRTEKRTRTAAMVTALTVVAMMALATPALAFGGFGIDEPVKTIPTADELLVIDGIYLGELVAAFPPADEGDEDDGAPIPDGGDWEMCPENDGPFPDGGHDGVVGPEEFPEDQQVPDDGADEPGDEQVPDDGTDIPEASTDPTPTPEVPEDDGDDTPSLPFTGGNAIGFAIAGIFILLAGVLVLGRGLTARS